MNQFRMLHYLQPRWREIVEAELPEVVEAFDRRRGAPFQSPRAHPAGDDRRRPSMATGVEALTARRPVAESATASVVDATPGISRSPWCADPGSGHRDGDCRWCAPRDRRGDRIRRGDRRGSRDRRNRPALAATSWLEAVGARPPIEIEEDPASSTTAVISSRSTGRCPGDPRLGRSSHTTPCRS